MARPTIKDLINALSDPTHPLHQKVLHHMEEAVEEVTQNIFKEIEAVSEVIDWESDLGKLRELKEESYQSIKSKYLKPKKADIPERMDK
jgi:hypothetical protein